MEGKRGQMVNGVTRTRIAERVGEIEARRGWGREGGSKRSNHDEMADRGWGPVCTRALDRWKRETGRAKKGVC